MDIEVKFDGEEIIVTKPRTDFMLRFARGPTSQTWSSPVAGSLLTPLPPAVSEFRALAFQAANAKTRELRWIV